MMRRLRKISGALLIIGLIVTIGGVGTMETTSGYDGLGTAIIGLLMMGVAAICLE